MAPKQRSAAKEILLALDADPALIEHYDANEIETIPLAAIQARLVDLGLMPTMPVKLQRILLESTPSPAADVLRVLADDFECVQPQDIEAYPLDEVTACLQRGGINYRAGVATIIDFMSESASDPVSLDKDQTKARPIKPATLLSRRSLFWVTIGSAATATAAVAASIGLFVTIEARQDRLIVDQRYEIQELSGQIQGLETRLKELRIGAGDLISLTMLVPPSNPLEHHTWPLQSDDSNTVVMSVGVVPKAQFVGGSGYHLDRVLCVDSIAPPMGVVSPETLLGSGSAHRVARVAELARCRWIIGAPEGVGTSAPRVAGSGYLEAWAPVMTDRLNNVEKSQPSGSAAPGPAAVGGGAALEGVLNVGMLDVFGRSNAFQRGAQALRAGDTKAALKSLEEAASDGEVMALWTLGRMYADGYGVNQSDQRAFDYFRKLVDSRADEAASTPVAGYVAKAFVEIGSYYLTGIANYIKPDPGRAHEMFSYAASQFGDPYAQYHLGRMYLDGQGIGKDAKQAVRWLWLAASNGQYHAQALLGAMLFEGESVPRDAARGLKYLILAQNRATPKETWITDLYNEALKQATEGERAAALVYVERWMPFRIQFPRTEAPSRAATMKGP